MMSIVMSTIMTAIMLEPSKVLFVSVHPVLIHVVEHDITCLV